MTTFVRRWRKTVDDPAEAGIELTLRVPLFVGPPVMDDQLLCTNCYARSTDSQEHWESTEFGHLCPECSWGVGSDGEVARAGIETSGMSAIAEVLQVAPKKKK